jgi:nicotinamidase-related amidase
MRAKLALVLVGLVLGVAGGYMQLAYLPQSISGLPDFPSLNQSPAVKRVELNTLSRSFFARDEKGMLVPETRDGRRYYKVDEGTYRFSRSIDIGRTALLVMDPWEDSGSEFLNAHFDPVLKKSLLPLIEKSLSLGMPVVVLTNAPSMGVDYGSSVHPEIEKLAQDDNVAIIYHQNTDRTEFVRWLQGMSIDTLIYSGFASNMCVIGRPLGMIPMQGMGFRLFFVPEASAAVEFENTWEFGRIHEATTFLISQWVGELISLNDFLSIPDTKISLQ